AYDFTPCRPLRTAGKLPPLPSGNFRCTRVFEKKEENDGSIYSSRLAGIKNTDFLEKGVEVLKK
ncbi:MAG: hypothetical protein JXJ04_07070, partial [Spirochaetales bacterium]|nr:hypothetical protein [Spirochaetales bacterium]